MATAVYSTVEIELRDGTEVTLKPLVISRLRKFMKAWKKVEEVTTEEENVDLLVECVGICLEKELREGKSVKDYREYIEDNMDMDTIYKVIEVCTGMKLNDPNLLAAAAEAAAKMQEAGTNSTSQD